MNAVVRPLAILLLLAVACVAEARSPFRIGRTLYFAEGGVALNADQREIVLSLGCLASSAEIVVVQAHASSREKRPLDLARLRAAEVKRMLQLAGAREDRFFIEGGRWHSQKENKLVDGWNQRVEIEVVIVKDLLFNCGWPIPEGKLPPRA